MSDTGFDRLMKFISAVGVIAGIFFTGLQIRDSADTASASLVYQIQRDGRDILKTASANADYVKCVDLGQECNEDELHRAYNGVRFVLQFYTSVNNQFHMGALEQNYWEAWKGEICSYLQLPSVAAYWSKFAARYSNSFQDTVESC